MFWVDLNNNILLKKVNENKVTTVICTKLRLVATCISVILHRCHISLNTVFSGNIGLNVRLLKILKTMHYANYTVSMLNTFCNSANLKQ